MQRNNPFPLTPYKQADLFCDRQKEIKFLEDALINGRNTVLLSLRRMGKTGLIKHLFSQQSHNTALKTVYIDIMDTQSVDDFANRLASSLIQAVPAQSKGFFNTFIKVFSGLNPIVTFDPQTGVPSLEFQLHSKQQQHLSIEKIFEYLESQHKQVCVAIDEFQQITNYASTGFEAFLRSKIQHLNKCNFIFSGSEQHILTNMFTSASKPFYQSADFLKLDRIPTSIYANFVVEKFAETKKIIAYETAHNLIEWLDSYTFYVQNFFNKLWFIADKKISSEHVKMAKELLLNERDYIYSNMRKMLTDVQFRLLEAIAKSGVVWQPTSIEFTSKYKLGTPSTVNSALKALQQKELIYHEKGSYKVYDVFLEKWFQK